VIHVFDRIRNKFRDKTTEPKKDEEQEAEEDQSYSTYKCASCATPLKGQPALYCDGCGQYYCYSCGVASGDMVWDCPNCAITLQRVNL
jgi:hypothetical protein